MKRKHFIAFAAGIVLLLLARSAAADPILWNPNTKVQVFFPVTGIPCMLIAFAAEYAVLRLMLKQIAAAGERRFLWAFLRANAISFPLAGITLVAAAMLASFLGSLAYEWKDWPPFMNSLCYAFGGVAGEGTAIVIEKLLYNRWIGLRAAGRRGWGAVVAANAVSCVLGFLLISQFGTATTTEGALAGYHAATESGVSGAKDVIDSQPH